MYRPRGCCQQEAKEPISIQDGRSTCWAVNGIQCDFSVFSLPSAPPYGQREGRLPSVPQCSWLWGIMHWVRDLLPTCPVQIVHTPAPQYSYFLWLPSTEKYQVQWFVMCWKCKRIVAVVAVKLELRRNRPRPRVPNAVSLRDFLIFVFFVSQWLTHLGCHTASQPALTTLSVLLLLLKSTLSSSHTLQRTFN